MKTLGITLLIIGFLTSAVIATKQEEIVNWWHFVPLFITGLAGVVLIRISSHRHRKGETKLASDINKIKTSIDNISVKIEGLNREKNRISVYDIHKKIDELFIDDLDNFAEARKSLIHKYDLQSYADLMNHFAAGERYLNRSWSASVDGYIDETHQYIEKAARQFKITKEHFETLS